MAAEGVIHSRRVLTTRLVIVSGLLSAALRAPWPGPQGPAPQELAPLLISMTVGAASVAVIAAVAARLAGPWAGGAAGLLGALSPVHTSACREATSVVTLVLLAAASLGLALEVDSSGRPSTAAVLGLLTGLMVCGPSALLGLAVLQAVWLAARPTRRFAAALSATVAVAVVALAGALNRLHSPLSEGAQVVWAPTTTLVGMVRCAGASFTRVAGMEYHLVVDHARDVAPLTALVTVVALVGARHLSPRPKWLLLGGAVVPFAVGALLSVATDHVAPLQADRMTPAIPSVVTLVAVGLASLRRWRRWAASMVVVVTMAFFATLALFGPRLRGRELAPSNERGQSLAWCALWYTHRRTARRLAYCAEGVLVKPEARQQGLLVRTLGRELVIYDLERHEAHCLNASASAVFRRCDGHAGVSDLAQSLRSELGPGVDEHWTALALHVLRGAHLLKGDPSRKQLAPAQPTSRRDMLRRTGSCAVLLSPAVASLVVPSPAEAVTCLPAGSCAAAANDEKPCYYPPNTGECAICSCASGICDCTP